jgi:hypothetical protein
MIDFVDELVKHVLGLVACDGGLKVAQSIVLAGLLGGLGWAQDLTASHICSRAGK